MSGVTCHVSCVTCHMSLTTRHQPLSLPPTVIVVYPPPANCPLCSTVCWFSKTQNHEEISKHNQIIETTRTKNSRCIPILAIRSLTRSLQSTRKLGFRDGTHTETEGRFSESCPLPFQAGTDKSLSQVQ